MCRLCNCTDSAACDTAFGPCAWFVTFGDNTGICTGCAPRLQAVWTPAESQQLRQDVAALPREIGESPALDMLIRCEGRPIYIGAGGR